MTYQDQLSQRMADTGMDGYAVTADVGWDMAIAWRSVGTLTEEAASTFSEWSGAIDRATQELARLWIVAPLDPDAWSDDAYSEEGGKKGGDPYHPYIEVMRGIDAVLAEPSEPLSWTYDEDASQAQVQRHQRMMLGFDGSRQGLASTFCTYWVDETGVLHTHGGYARGYVDSWVAPTEPTRAAPESPQERALRLRRCRGTGPARPSAQEAHRPRRHT